MVSRSVNSIQGELSSYAIDENGGPHSMIKNAIWDNLIEVRTVTHPMGGSWNAYSNNPILSKLVAPWKTQKWNMLREMALAARIELHNTGVCAQAFSFC